MEANETIQNNQEASAKKSRAKKVVLFGLGTLALGTLAFFGFKHFKKTKNENNDETDQTNDDLDSKTTVQNPPRNKPRTSLPSPGIGDAFPLRFGSKGDKVRLLQQALIRTYGAGILKKFGADGDFGSELQSALRTKGYGVPLSESEYNKITGKKEEEQIPPPPLLAFDPAAIAKAIYAAIIGKDFNTTITLLKAIKNTTDYSLVSEQLKNNYRIAGVRQTLVNASLNTFTESSQKTKVQEAFKNMGLKYDGTKWSLSGFRNNT
jgi:peptidoglycan hydrolase-like protein with peptidoglycan-binding domain